MSSTVVVLVYLLAIGIPAFLLYRFHSQSWPWHVLAIAAAFGLGFMPTPPAWKTIGFDLAFGFGFIFLLAWGFGGLVMYRPHGSHRHKHA